jgi:hypothetical protein
MVGEEGMGNGEGTEELVQPLKIEAMDNGFGNDGVEASSGSSEGFRTYKRRRNTRSSLDGKGQQDGKSFMEAASRLADQVAHKHRPSMPIFPYVISSCIDLLEIILIEYDFVVKILALEVFVLCILFLFFALAKLWFLADHKE